MNNNFIEHNGVKIKPSIEYYDYSKLKNPGENNNSQNPIRQNNNNSSYQGQGQGHGGPRFNKNLNNNNNQFNQYPNNQNNFNNELFFIPNRGNFSKGIFTSIYLKFDKSIENSKGLLKHHQPT